MVDWTPSRIPWEPSPTAQAESGAQAGALVTSGDVQVDGEVETRRGRQLGDGAVVTVALPGGARVLRVVTGDDVDVPW